MTEDPTAAIAEIDALVRRWRTRRRTGVANPSPALTSALLAYEPGDWAAYWAAGSGWPDPPTVETARLMLATWTEPAARRMSTGDAVAAVREAFPRLASLLTGSPAGRPARPRRSTTG
ncbi:MAG TPA: hypothetical protein VHB02_17890 [Acidimicrobiales bacterium]|nr:hypothetical protein [Acidimicrobiales bacterium]